MACITVPIDNSMKDRMNVFSWINWSDVGREEVMKKEIFERYIQKKKLFKEDLKFCERIDWHPVDELPLKESFVKKLKEIEKSKYSKPMSSKELEKWLDKL